MYIKEEISLSIIIPTLGRKEEVESLLESIKKSNHTCSYEVIIVDQNQNGLLDETYTKYKDELPLTREVVQFRGLSRAKNYGVKIAKGNIVCFPDDDAEFLPDTIMYALNKLTEKKADCVFGKVIDKETKKDSVMLFKKESMYLSLEEFEGAFIEATMFAYRGLLHEYRYDEDLGVGTIHGAQEGYDLVYRLLLDKKSLYYDPRIVFYHPNKISEKVSDNEVRRAFYYSCGFAYLCRKHGFTRKYKERLRKISLALPVIYIVKHKEYRYFRAQKMGLILGYDYI